MSTYPKVTVKTAPPTTPPVESVTLTLSPTQAEHLRALTARVRWFDNGEIGELCYAIYNTLGDGGVGESSLGDPETIHPCTISFPYAKKEG